MGYISRKAMAVASKIRSPKQMLARTVVSDAMKRRAWLSIYAPFLNDQEIIRVCDGALDEFAAAASCADCADLTVSGGAKFLGDYFAAIPSDDRIKALKALKDISPATFAKLLEDK